jgi:hypothetical protein
VTQRIAPTAAFLWFVFPPCRCEKQKKNQRETKKKPKSLTGYFVFKILDFRPGGSLWRLD